MNKILLLKKENFINKDISYLFDFINKIGKEYENIIFSEMSKQHTYTLCFAKDYLRMFSDEYNKEIDSTRKNFMLLDKFRDIYFEYDYSETIKLSYIVYDNMDLYFLNFNDSNIFLNDLLSNYCSSYINNESIKEIINFSDNITSINFTFEIVNEKILYDAKYTPTDLERIQEAIYYYVTNNNNNLSFENRIKLRETITENHISNFINMYNKVSELLGITIDIEKEEFTTNDNTLVKNKKSI